MSQNNQNQLFNKLWKSADKMRANTSLRLNEFYIPVLGLIFLRYADTRFQAMKKELERKQKSFRRKMGPEYFQAKGVLFVPPKARYSYLLNLPESENMGRIINDAMKLIEKKNRNLKDVLPKTFLRLDNRTIFALLKLFSQISMDISGDVFGKIYEYFLGKFASGEGQRGGEFFTPTSIVKLIVEVIEPYSGRIYDPASGSAGMFVQSAKFIERNKKNPTEEISIFGQEKIAATIKLAKMNLTVRGLEGDIRQGNSIYQDIHSSLNRFDFVMANPPFNLKGVNKEQIENDSRYSYGIPNTNNANYLWIQIFLNSLNEKGRAGFVMANSAADAGQSEKRIREKIIEDNAVDVMIAVGSNFFHNVTLPCTLWFFDRGKKNTERKDKVLFVDAREIYHEIDRAHRDFTDKQLEFLHTIVKAYRQESFVAGGNELIAETFPENKYENIKGLCKVATIKEIKAQGWSLNPGRYVGVADTEDDGIDFKVRLEELNDKLNSLNSEAQDLEQRIKKNVGELLK